MKLILEQSYPRATVTTRISGLKGNDAILWSVPHASRGRKIRERSLDLFKMRRCIDDLHPDPGVSRLYLFRDEDVPGAVLQGLQR